MEDVLDLYEEDYDERYPTVCFDEKLVTLHANVNAVVPVAPGTPARIDYEYERHGTANLFFFLEPLTGWRHVRLTERRTKLDYAHCLQWLADERYPHAEYIRVVQDNLNTHLAASLYEAFTPAEARRLAQRFEWHYTPKHGSWLNMVEIEIGIFERGCLKQRVPDEPTLLRHIQALEVERNVQHARIKWQFTARDARTKLKRLYPTS